MTGPDYRYEFDSSGHIHVPNGDTWQPIASTSLDGVRTATWLGPFLPDERDLLRVMSAILEADRLSPRRLFEGKRLRRDVSWQRQITLQIAVEVPELWNGTKPLLSELLSFMTDDVWDFTFDGIVTHSMQQQQLPFVQTKKETEVALFSGGLDSVAGLYARSKIGNGDILVVSACGNEVQGKAQKEVLDKLRSCGVAARWLKFDRQLRGANRSRARMEVSQRSRALLFLSMGAATASQLHLSTFSVYETGVGCLNLPTSAAQIGAEVTRAMHPKTLTLFNRLSDIVLTRRPHVIAPFFFHTKGELCRHAGEALSALTRFSMSCDEGEGHKPNAMQHCGVCTSCLFRRIALHSAGLYPDPTAYRDHETRRHGSYELKTFENHACNLLAARDFDGLVDLDPDARFATLMSVEALLTVAATRTAVFDMYQRYAREVLAFLNSARPTIVSSGLRPRKEPENDLFAATR